MNAVVAVVGALLAARAAVALDWTVNGDIWLLAIFAVCAARSFVLLRVLHTSAGRRIIWGTKNPRAWFAVKAVVLAPLIEEIIFRGWLQPEIGVLGATFLFVAVHQAQTRGVGIISLPFTAALGCLFAWVFARYGIVASILVHAAANASAVAGTIHARRWLRAPRNHAAMVHDAREIMLNWEETRPDEVDVLWREMRISWHEAQSLLDELDEERAEGNLGKIDAEFGSDLAAVFDDDDAGERPRSAWPECRSGVSDDDLLRLARGDQPADPLP